MCTTFQMLFEQQSYFTHEILKLFFECKENNITTDETFTLLNEFLYPVYELEPIQESK